MRRVLVILMAIAMAVSLFAAVPFAASADADTAVWSGKANIKWYLDALEGNPNADEFHIATAEDLAGLAYLVDAYYDKDNYKTCYNGLWYDTETGDVLGFALSGAEGGYCIDFEKAGYYIPASGEQFNKKNGQYVPKYDDDYENIIDGSAQIDGQDFQYKIVYLDADIVLNTGDAADWATTAPANVWMPIGGGRSSDATFSAFNGEFQGQGHTVSGAYYTTDDSDNFGVGLFGYVAKGRAASIHDLTVANSYFCGGTATGALIGRTQNMVTVFNCHVKDTIVKAGSYVGAFVGGVHGGSVLLEQCGATNVAVEGQKAVGGFVGGISFQGFSITDCIISGTVKASQITSGDKLTGGWDVGILVGRIAQGSITVARVIADVELVQEGDDDSDGNYSPSAGVVYGAVAKTHKAPSPVSIEACYYVNTITAGGTVIEFPLATPVQESQLQGKAPKANVSGFDFENIWDYGDKGELPVLRNAGAKTGTDDESGDDSGESGETTTEHVFTPDTWVKEKKATCLADGVKGHYECPHCGKYFAADKETELSAEDLKLAKVDHTYGDLIAEVAATTEAAGTVAHYHCETCGKDFDANKNELSSITIPKLEKSGCGGVIVGVPFIAVVVLGAAVLLRKKENESK